MSPTLALVSGPVCYDPKREKPNKKPGPSVGTDGAQDYGSPGVSVVAKPMFVFVADCGKSINSTTLGRRADRAELDPATGNNGPYVAEIADRTWPK